MSRSSRSAAGRLAGDFALTTLEELLGSDWAALAWEKHGRDGLPPELLLSSAHAVAFAQLLEVALRLKLLPVDGVAKVRRALRGDPRPQQIVHVKLQLELAGLVRAAASPVAFEVLGTGKTAPTDVVIGNRDAPIGVETFAILTPQAHVDVDRYSTIVFDRVMLIHTRNDVGIVGHFDVQSDEETTAMLDSLEHNAVLVARDGEARSLHDEEYSFEVDLSGRLELTGPSTPAEPWPRVERRLKQKAAAAGRSSATWLRIDVLSGLWQFTPWGKMELPAKADTLATAIRGALGGEGHLAGLVVSSGALLRQGTFRTEDAEVNGVRALRRLLEPVRVRETFVIPLRATPDATVFADLYDTEPSWIDWALHEVGLPSSAEVFAWDE